MSDSNMTCLVPRGIVAVLLVLGVVHAATPVPVRHYLRTFDCGSVRIEVRGAQCRNEDDCPALSGVSEETVVLEAHGRTWALPPVAERFRSASAHVDPRRLYIVSAVACGAGHEVTVLYWGGGNCSSVCEVAVRYASRPNGGGWRTILLPRSRDWQIGSVRLFQADDRASHTVWLDPS